MLCPLMGQLFLAPVQCSKLLADTSVIQFYPSKFVLITDILDNFGKQTFNNEKCTWYAAWRLEDFLLGEMVWPAPVPYHWLSVLGYLVFDRIRRKSTYMPPGSVKPVMLPGKIWTEY